MITGEIKSHVDKVWNTFWSGGISNPLEVIEQITYLLFLKRLDDLSGDPSSPADIVTVYRDRYEREIAGLQGGEGASAGAPSADGAQRLRRELLQSQREALLRLRDEGDISDEVMREIERDLDLEEARFAP